MASVACLANAHRCGRIHCYFTGPLYLLGAAATRAYGLGVIRLASKGWEMIAVAMLIGSLVFSYLPERLWGKYGRLNFSSVPEA